MKIILLKKKNLHPKKYRTGDIADIPDNVAQGWIEREIAKPLSKKKLLPKRIKSCKPTSIVIPVKDALDYLKKCISSLKKYTNNYELVIIDNGSSKNTKRYIKGLDAVVVTNKENTGFSYACNQGIKVSNHEFICFLNSDTVLTPDWLCKMQGCFRVNPDCGITSPSTCFSGGEQCDWSIASKRFEMSENDIWGYASKLKEDYKVSDIFGFCMLTKKSILSEIGGFDWKRYGLGNSEEKDLMWRLEQVGYKNYWTCGAYVHHYGHKTFDEMGINPAQNLRANRKIFQRRKKNDLFVKNDVWIPQIEDKIDVIIPVLDRPEETIKTLKSLFANNENINVIIIDNGSIDLSYLDGFDVKIIKNRKNFGTPKALNQGLNISRSKYVVLMHNDIVINTKDWIKTACDFLDRDDKAGLVGIAGWTAIRENGSYSRKDIVTAIDKYNAKPYSFAEVAMCDGSCVVARNCEIKYDEVYGPMHFYDFDFSMQYRKAGYRLYAMNGSATHFAEDRKKSTVEHDKYKSLIGKKDIDFWKENQVKFMDKWSDDLPVSIEPIPILMITWNRLQYTKKAIEALKQNTYYPYILWIWDNGSTDGTVEYLRKLDDVRVYFSKDNLGLVPPMNKFFETFKDFDYVSKVDNDTVVSPGWLTKLKEVMDKYPLFVIQSDHYLGLPYKLKNNQQFYNHLEKVKYGNESLYLFPHVSGTGVLIRRKHIDRPVEEMKGTLSGWVNYQFHRCKEKNLRCAFYSGVWVDRLDFTGTNKVNNDYPQYLKKINLMRSKDENNDGFGHIELPVRQLKEIKKTMKLKWY